MFGKLKNIYQELSLWHNYIFRNPHRRDAPLTQRFKTMRHGFYGNMYAFYDFKNNDINEYISDIERWRSRDINGDYRLILDDKILFSLLFSPYIRTPKLYSWVNNGKVIPINGSGLDNSSLVNRIREEGSLIIKPLSYGSGHGVALMKWQNGNFTVNEAPKSETEIISFVTAYENSIIMETLTQSEYGNSLYPGSVNTVRIITARKKEETEFRTICAIQRMGSDKSAPVDNYDSGGYATYIDMDSGILGPVISSRDLLNGRPVPHDTHPDTGGQIRGIRVPDWDELKDTVLAASNAFPFLRFIAWDIAVCPDGFYAIEANASSGLQPFQVFGGFRNTPLGDIFRSYNIIRK